MLILTRRIGEEIFIGDDIKIVNLGIRGGQVQVGIDAPKNIPVHRAEVYEKIQLEKEENAGENLPQSEEETN